MRNLTPDQRALLTDEERQILEMVERANVATVGVSEQGHTGVLWSLFTDYPLSAETRIASFREADDALFYKDVCPAVPVLLTEIARLRERVGQCERCGLAISHSTICPVVIDEKGEG